LSISYRIGRQN